MRQRVGAVALAVKPIGHSRTRPRVSLARRQQPLACHLWTAAAGFCNQTSVSQLLCRGVRAGVALLALDPFTTVSLHPHIPLPPRSSCQVKTSRLFLRDVTAVSPLTCLLFGPEPLAVSP